MLITRPSLVFLVASVCCQSKAYRRWNCKTPYLGLRRCWLPVILYFLNKKLLNVISGKLPWFFLFVRRIFCKNVKPWCWFVFSLKNKECEEILKRCDWVTCFWSFSLAIKLNRLLFWRPLYDRVKILHYKKPSSCGLQNILSSLKVFRTNLAQDIFGHIFCENDNIFP